MFRAIGLHNKGPFIDLKMEILTQMELTCSRSVVIEITGELSQL
jgi:hypothetical protein